MSRSPIALPYETDAGVGARARLGLIVLASDLTVETEIRSLPLDDIALHHSRIPNDLHVSAETLTAMEQELPRAAALLPHEFDFDAIGYGCTSASTLIGDDGVAAAIHSAHPGVPVTNPIEAVVAAFKTLELPRVGVVTPYSEAVTLPIIDRLEGDGLEVTAFGSYLIENDLTVARLSPASVAAGARRVRDEAPCDAIFISCTSVQLYGDVERLEAELGIPVISSNLALAWRLLRLGGITDQFPGFGTLFARA